MTTLTSSDIRRFAKRSHAEKLANAHARRARDANGGTWNGYWSPQQWLALLAEHDYTCAYCGEQFPPDRLTPDHRTPLIRGGRNAIDNLLPACQSCNSAKGGKTEAEYRAYLETKETTKMTTSRLNAALLDVLLPSNVKSVVRNRLNAYLTTIITTHGDQERCAEEREALGKLAALSELLYGDANRLPRTVRAKLLTVDLEALGEEVA